MSISAYVEKMAVEMLAQGKLDVGAMESKFGVLRAALTDNKGKELLGKLSAAVFNRNEGAAYRDTLRLLDEISKHVGGSGSGKFSAATAGASTDKNLLQYDLSHGPEILESFLSELGGHLEVVEREMLHLESHPADKPALNSVFGAMHSLKGISGFMGVTSAHTIAHEAETIMDLARSRASGIEAAECNAILATVDALRQVSQLIHEHSRQPAQAFPPIPPACEKVMALLRGLLHPSPLPDAPAAEIGGQTVRPVCPPISAVDVEAVQPEPVQPATEHRSVTRALEAGLVRVKVEKLDGLLDAIGELVIIQSQVSDDPLLRQLENPRLARNLALMNTSVRRLHEVALSLRMFPLRETFGRTTRLARDLARKQEKDIEVAVSGETTELDKHIVEALTDPLTHLARNAVDHGIETPAERTAAGKTARARLALSAKHQGGSVIIEVGDDGRGLNLERILYKGRQRGMIPEGILPQDPRVLDLIFEPGFSTRDSATEVSGRGVGLDVVKNNIEALGGRVSVHSERGKSTTFTLVLPLTLAIMDSLVVRVGGERYLVPLNAVIETLQPQHEHISTVHEHGELVDFRGTHVPLVRLHRFARVKPDIQEPWNAIVMVVEGHGERYGLMVDELLGQQQVVIKGLDHNLKGAGGIAGGGVMSDGRVGLILDIAGVLAASRKATAKIAG